MNMLTLVIPTKDRALFLKRLLRYYMSVRCPFPILIGDSSTSEQLKETQKFLSDEVGDQLKIEHLLDPSANNQVGAQGWQADAFMSGLMDHVKTPYVAFYADDDFAIIPNLQKAVNFLETNRDFSFVCGEAILFTLKSQGVFGEIEGTNYYLQSAFEQTKASQRLSALFSSYAVLEYGVSRTVQKKIRWSAVFDTKVNNTIGELVNMGLVAIQGKVHKMDELLLVRQGHSLQTSKGSDSQFDLVIKICSGDSLFKLIEIFSKELVKREKDLKEEEAGIIVKKCLWNFLATRISPPGAMNIKRNLLYDRLVNALKKNEKLKKLGLSIYSCTFSGRMKLPALLNNAFPYHADFLPVYKVVTEIHS